jgi:hypothetical protein
MVAVGSVTVVSAKTPQQNLSRYVNRRERQTILLNVDQVLSSVSNLLIVVIPALFGTLKIAGEVTVAVTVSMIILSISRGLITDPLFVSAEQRKNSDGSAGAILVVSALLIVPGIGIVTVLLGNLGLTLVFAFTTVAVTLQDGLRQVALANKRTLLAVWSDGIWLLATAVVYVALRSSLRSSASVLLPWGLGAVAGCLPLFFALRPPLSGRRGIALLRSDWAFRISLAGESLATNGVVQAMVLAVALGAGRPDAATARFLLSAFGPVQIVFVVLFVRGSWLIESEPLGFALPRIMRSIAGWLCITTTVTCVILLALPLRLGKALAGDLFLASRSEVIWFSFAMAATAVGSAATAGLRYLKAAQLLLKVRIIAGFLSVSGIYFASRAYGVRGFSIAFLCTNLVLSWVLLILIQRELDSLAKAGAAQTKAPAGG